MTKRIVVITTIMFAVCLLVLLIISGATAANQPAGPIDTTRIAQDLTLQTKVPDIDLAQTAGAGSGECQPGSCDQCATHGEKIKCLNQELLAESCSTARLLASPEFAPFAPLEATQVVSTCVFAEGMVNSSKPTEFASIGLTRTAEAVVEYTGPDRSCNDPDDPTCLGPGYAPDGNLDGICELKSKGAPATVDLENLVDPIPPHGKKPNDLYREWCAEVMYDNIGDDDGFCEYQGRGPAQYLEPCVKASNVSAIDQQPDNFNDGKLIGIEDALADATAAVRAVRTGLVTSLSELQALQTANNDYSFAGGPEVCLDMLNAYPTDTRPAYEILQTTLGVSVFTSGGYNTCSAAAQQDVAGFNGSTVCVAFGVVDALFQAAHTTIELIDDAITGSRVDNVATCLEYVADNLQGIQDSLDYKVEWRRLHLAVIELVEKSDYLVSVAEAGRPSYIVSHTVRVSERAPVLFVTVDDYATWSEVDSAAGLWQVHLDLPPSLSNVQLFLFEVSHTETFTGTSVMHSGFTVFDRDSLSSICTGQ